MRCDGFRRYGGAFSLGPVVWQQCNNKATVMITCRQDGEKASFPACEKCWEEARENTGVEITDVRPLTGEPHDG